MLQPGSELRGRYRIESFLGRGGMSDVYLALDTRRQVQVAVKVLREDLAEDPEFIQRFRHEAEALARLDHPYVVRFYSFERQGAVAFIVMDYVPGTTLRRRLMEVDGPLPLVETTHILQQVAKALHYAHSEGYVHRDIKPGNIMLRSDGAALLADFGIARAAEASTMSTAALGTPAYMSPEQILGRKLDSRTDIYSLGVVLYELVTGKRPFMAGSSTNSSIEEVRQDHLHRPPPDPRGLNPNLPPEAAAVILRALAKSPDDRWPDTISLLRAWEDALGVTPSVSAAVPLAMAQPVTATSTAPPVPSPTPTPPQRRSRRLVWVLVAMLGIIGITVGFVQFVLPLLVPTATPIVMVSPTLTATTDPHALAETIVAQTRAAESTATAAASQTSVAATATEAFAATATSNTMTAEAVATYVRQTETAIAQLHQTETTVAQQTRTVQQTQTAEAQAAPKVIAANGVYLRAGPGTEYPEAGTLPSGQSMTVVGRNAAGTWWQVLDSGGNQVWVKASVVGTQGAVDKVPTVTVPTPTAGPTVTIPPPPPSGSIVNFERPTSWKRGDQSNGTFDSQSKDQVHSGSYAGHLHYQLPGTTQNFVVFSPNPPLAIAPQPTGIRAWVYGDGSGHSLNVWLIDAKGERRSYSFGNINHTGWQPMTAWIQETGWPNGHIGGTDNGVLDFPARLYALVLDNTNGPASSGDIYIDDVAVTQEALPAAPATPAPPSPGGGTSTTGALLPGVVSAPQARGVGALMVFGILMGILAVIDPRSLRRGR